MYNTISPSDRRIFGRSKSPASMTRNRKKFQQFYRPVFPSFIEKLDSCQCLGSMSVCPLARRILNQSQIVIAEKKYQQIKKSAIIDDTMNYERQIPSNIDKILQPHLKNLIKVINVQRIQPLFQILRHSKCQFITFWIYALLCKKWTCLAQFTENIKKIADKNRMQINFESSEIQQKIKQLHATKISTISDDNYLKVVNLIMEKDDFAPKLVALYLVQGRKRQSYEVIKASIELE